MAPAAVSRGATQGVDVASLFDRYRRERRAEDLDALVQRFLPLARHLARRYSSSREREDLEQVAALALVKAIVRFNPDRGVAFTSFAVPTIAGELKRYFRDLGWSVRVPRSLQELAAKADDATERLVHDLGRFPTAEEVAAECDTTAEHVLEARATASAHRPESLDRPAGNEDASSVGELLGSDDPGYAEVDRSSNIDTFLARLPERQQAIVRMRFEEELTQREIGQRIGVSQMHVSRLLRESLTTLRAATDTPARCRGRANPPSVGAAWTS
jgi:RNA polymerase sigma-B factor